MMACLLYEDYGLSLGSMFHVPARIKKSSWKRPNNIFTVLDRLHYVYLMYITTRTTAVVAM